MSRQSAYHDAVDNEMAKLSDEVARLRLMVERVQLRQNQLDAHQRSSSEQSSQPTGTPAYHRDPWAVPPVPLPGSPVAVLPTIFSGVDGTTRLFKLLLETYPWLEPPEVRQAREIVASDQQRASQRIAELEAETDRLRKEHEVLKAAASVPAEPAVLSEPLQRPPRSASTPSAADRPAKHVTATPQPQAMSEAPMTLGMGRFGAKKPNRQQAILRKISQDSEDDSEDVGSQPRRTPLPSEKKPVAPSTLDMEF